MSGSKNLSHFTSSGQRGVFVRVVSIIAILQWPQDLLHSSNTLHFLGIKLLLANQVQTDNKVRFSQHLLPSSNKKLETNY